MRLKVFLKLKKTLKPSFPGKKTQKTPKKPKKTQKKPKKTHWAGFFLKTRVFSNPDPEWFFFQISVPGSQTHIFESLVTIFG
jgi:hypothetical protein